MSERRNVIVFGCGPKGSGKSQFLAHHYTSKTTRVLSLDFTGETHEQNPDAIRTFGFRELREALIDFAHAPEWHIAAAVDEEDCERVFALLAPPIVSEDTTSYPRAIGGMALECGECDVIAPNKGSSRAVRNAIKRGRHHLLSLYLATQRPSECDRLCSSQADVFYTFRHSEPRELEDIRRRTSQPIAEIVAELPQYHSLVYVRDRGVVSVLDEHYREYRRLSPRGEDLRP